MSIDTLTASRSIASNGGDVPGDISTTAVLTTASPVMGVINEAFDQDWYRFDVFAGSTYVFDLQGSISSEKKLSDPLMRLIDADGNEIALSDDAIDLDSEIAFAAISDGHVFVSAESFGGDTGSYWLTAREFEGDVPGSTATTAALAVGGSVEGTVDFGTDQDWYRVEVEAGKTYLFDLEGAETSAGTLSNPFLQLFDADGNFLFEVSDGGVGNNARLGFSAATDGVVLVAAQGEFGPTGSYRLSTSELDEGLVASSDYLF